MTRISTQIFGLGKEFSEDIPGTIRRLCDIGFDGIEPFVIFTEKQGKLPPNFWALDTLNSVKPILDELGMTIPSVHIGATLGWFSLPVKTVAKNILKLHENLGIRDFVVSAGFETLHQVKRTAKFMRKISDAVRPYGCRVLYHNHDCEFHKISYRNQTVDAMEVFLELAGDDMLLQLDIGWAGIAGDEKEIVRRYGDRIASLHLKDFNSEYRNGQHTYTDMPIEAFAPIGEGVITTKEILAIRDQLPNYGGDIIIDQDKTTGEMLEDLKVGHDHIRAML